MESRDKSAVKLVFWNLRGQLPWQKHRPNCLLENSLYIYPIVIGLAFWYFGRIHISYSFINPLFGFVLMIGCIRALVFLVISCPCALVINYSIKDISESELSLQFDGYWLKRWNYLDAITSVIQSYLIKQVLWLKRSFEIGILWSYSERFQKEELIHYNNCWKIV